MNQPAPSPTAGSPILALTGLRAYAAVWVMLLHLQFGVGVKGHVVFGAIVNHGYWAVDVFFVLSGFILSLVYASKFEARLALRNYWPYLSARFARIYPLHLFAIGLLATYFLGRAALGYSRGLPEGFNLHNLWLNLALLHGWGYATRLSWNFPSWSISTEWFAYLLLLPFFARGLRRVPLAGVMALATAAWTLLYFTVHRFGDMIGQLTVQGAPMRILAEFLLGYALYRLYLGRTIQPRTADALAAAGLAGILVLSLLPARSEWLLAPAVCCLLFGLTQPGPLGQRLFASRWAVFWGERSYSIYMMHAVVQIFANVLIETFGLREMSDSTAWLVVAIQIVAVLAVSHFTYEWIEVPMRHRTRGLLEQQLPSLLRRAPVAPAQRAAP